MENIYGEPSNCQHAPDWQGMAIYVDHGVVVVGELGQILVDVPCTHCGASGSFALVLPEVAADIQWD